MSITHNTKIRRALEKAAIGARPNSAAAMLGYIPETVIEKISSELLAELVDNIWGACVASKAVAQRQIYEKRKEVMRSIPSSASREVEPEKAAKPAKEKTFEKPSHRAPKMADKPSEEAPMKVPAKRGRPRIHPINAAA